MTKNKRLVKQFVGALVDSFRDSGAGARGEMRGGERGR